MTITIPSEAEARAVLEALYPSGLVINDNMVEFARYRIALGLEPLTNGNNDIQERMLKRLILHENRLDQYEAILQDHEARLDVLEGP